MLLGLLQLADHLAMGDREPVGAAENHELQIWAIENGLEIPSFRMSQKSEALNKCYEASVQKQLTAEMNQLL